jgi:hypothetical protein
MGIAVIAEIAVIARNLKDKDLTNPRPSEDGKKRWNLGSEITQFDRYPGRHAEGRKISGDPVI